MAGERLTAQDLVESSSNSPLELVDPDNGITITDHDYTPPAKNSLWVSSADTEGSLLSQHQFQNREIGLQIRVAEPLDGASTNLATNPKGGKDTTGWAGVSLAAGPTRAQVTNYPTNVPTDYAINAQGNADDDYL